MTLTVDFADGEARSAAGGRTRSGDPLVWECTDDGATATRDTDYAPTLWVTREDGPVAAARETVADMLDVTATTVERRRRGWRADPEPVLRVTVDRVDRVRSVATKLVDLGRPGEYRCYGVDLSPGFRYCLDRGLSPVPDRELRTLELGTPEAARNGDPLDSVTVDGDSHEGNTGDLVTLVADAVAETDPDVLVLDAGATIPTLYEAAATTGQTLQLGRRPGWKRLAGDSTYESYGQVHHSPARYTVPGRAVVDRSNTFFYEQAGLDGCLDLVARSWKPLQELAWASIGNVLTAIQIREARDRGVLVPWRSYRHERFKSARTLADADRGGHTLEPAVGVHEDVHELDFGSLYPSIMIEYNLSPETVCCDCHDRADVPGLGYSVCDDRGYLPDVLAPLVTDRRAMKRERAATDDPERRQALDRKIEAIKWILVSCFGYQGFSNAKFGRIECHEAINAYAREILLDAKAELEAGGWRVLHGIVDSLWVTAAPDVPDRDRTPLDELAERVSTEAGVPASGASEGPGEQRSSGVPLEYEAAYDWIAFVPRADSESGALTKYFGKVTDPDSSDDGYTYRGIECRQDSTPPFVADCQRELIRTFDTHHEPEPICDRLAGQLRDLRTGAVDPGDLIVEKRVSKDRAAYDQYTHSVAALDRLADAGIDRHAGQRVRYVVTDDDCDSRERVRLARESPTDYDAECYADRLVRAAESVCAPLGWRRGDIEDYLAERTDASLSAFGR
ncbi:DNA polymerase I [Halorientalis persicus]|uniref:DNA-directed DNA polymerase n=1 Tax=Halorientalis persicus TaxID=1367881 RepID=A0A1H8FKQ9_9EURY|nr:type B DNA-directed DNA polymerase [Halorientalis persicus]SEN32104.1 DNA polymerase I [Halorientalis persicus]